MFTGFLTLKILSYFITHRTCSRTGYVNQMSQDHNKNLIPDTTNRQATALSGCTTGNKNRTYNQTQRLISLP